MSGKDEYVLSDISELLIYRLFPKSYISELQSKATTLFIWLNENSLSIFLQHTKINKMDDCFLEAVFFGWVVRFSESDVSYNSVYLQ